MIKLLRQNNSQAGVNKHLMTCLKGNSEFCFPETLSVPRGEAEGNIEVEGKQNSLFPEGPVIKCFVIPPDSKIEKAPKKIICLRPLHMLWFKFISSSNFFKLVHIFQTGSYFSNQFIFFKLVHIYQTGSYFSNWVEIFKPV